MSNTDPAPSPSSAQPQSGPSSYFSYPVSHVVSGLYRRLTEPDRIPRSKAPPPQTLDAHNGIYTPPQRTLSPFQPPPLTPLNLNSGKASPTSLILTRALAEEIRLLVPPRLQLEESWSLAYSLEEDGVSLSTLYGNLSAPSIPKGNSFVLVVKDAAGGIFGAYLTDAPHPSASFYGTGECFLWRSSILPSVSTNLMSSLPPPPSAPESDSLGRSTTIASPTSPASSRKGSRNLLSPVSSGVQKQNGTGPSLEPAVASGTSTPTERIRFKAFPYSGVNDYLIFCEHGFLSVGGGDGKYGLWLDGVLERGISSPCMTFGNEGLSEEGEKFEVVGVEVWCVGG
ncbi:MAG: hypothetical protein Q9174_000322 [Haloplaca sp. 1 TL-2023]